LEGLLSDPHYGGLAPTFAYGWIGAGPCNTNMPRDRSSVDVQDVGHLLAAERTLLAWIQTGIVCMAVGILVARFGLFAREPTIASDRHGATTLTDTMIGIAIVTAGVVLDLWGSIRHLRLVLRLCGNSRRVAAYGASAFGLATGLAGISLVLLLLGVAL
jgi:inner membrane protein YidH